MARYQSPPRVLRNTSAQGESRPWFERRWTPRLPISSWRSANVPRVAELTRAEREMEELNRIGIALSQTHEVGRSLEMILTKAREITGADAGSLYLVEETAPGCPVLRARATAISASS